MGKPKEVLEQARTVLEDWKDWLEDDDIVEIQMKQGTHHKRYWGEPDDEIGPNRKRTITIEINGGAEDTTEVVNNFPNFSIGGKNERT